MRSGTGVGPGICRKWRPAVRAVFWGMASFQEVGRRMKDRSAGIFHLL
jgi:hypothetical protein